MPRRATKATDTIHPGGGFDKAVGYQEDSSLEHHSTHSVPMLEGTQSRAG